VREYLQNITNANVEIRDFSGVLFIMNLHENFLILVYCKVLIA
jgi:hypothetical protein